MKDITVTLRKDFKFEESKTLKAGTELQVIDIMITEDREVSFLCLTDNFMDWVDVDYLEEKY